MRVRFLFDDVGFGGCLASSLYPGHRLLLGENAMPESSEQLLLKEERKFISPSLI